MCSDYKFEWMYSTVILSTIREIHPVIGTNHDFNCHTQSIRCGYIILFSLLKLPKREIFPNEH